MQCQPVITDQHCVQNHDNKSLNKRMFDVIFLELALSFILAFGNGQVDIVSYPGNRYRLLNKTDNKFCSTFPLIFVYDDSSTNDFVTETELYDLWSLWTFLVMHAHSKQHRLLLSNRTVSI